MRTVYLDGHFVPESEAKLSIYDLSVMQAAAAFEMTRSFKGVHFKLFDHLLRLIDSCKRLSIPIEQSISQLEYLCELTAQKNDHGPGEEHRLLIVVSPGCAPMYKDLEGVIPHPFVYIADFPLRYTVAGFGKYFTEGVHCVTSTIQQVPDACVPSAAKHRSRLHFHLAQQQAPADTWPLMQDAMGWFCEAPGANLVQVSHGKIRSIGRHSLPGISLQTVRELADTTEGAWHASYTTQIDELWLTGTPFCMLPVVSLDGKPIGDGKIGPVYKETLVKWSTLVGVDIHGQIESWDAARP
jgi:branched-chain amino acid aminotransferase